MSHPTPPAASHDTPSSSSRPTTPPWSASTIANSPTVTRAITFPSKAKNHITHRLHHSHNFHHHHHHHHHHQRDKSIPHSAAASIPSSLHAFGESLTALAKIGSSLKSGVEEAKGMDKEGGEREWEEAEEAEEAEGDGDGGVMERMKRMRKKMGEGDMWKEVERKREEGRKAQEVLHHKLHSLTTLSTSTTRRLDYTYYSLLTHLSTLSTLTTQLSDLSSTSTTLLTSFDTKTSLLLSTSSAQIHTFNALLDKQIARIAELEHRLNWGRRSVAELGSRLDGVRKKVQREERREKEGEERVRRRLRILWGVLGAGLVLFLVLGVVRCWPGRREEGNRGNAAAVVGYAGIERDADIRKISGSYEAAAKLSGFPPGNNHPFPSSSSSPAEPHHAIVPFPPSSPRITDRSECESGSMRTTTTTTSTRRASGAGEADLGLRISDEL